MHVRFLLAALLLLALPARAEGQDDPEPTEGTGGAGTAEVLAPKPKAERRIEGLGIPLVNYNSDFGLGYGAAGGMYVYAPGHAPYQHAISGQFYRTTRGIESHFLRWDAPDLLPGVRLEAQLKFRRELRSPYFGEGNLSAPDFRGDLDDPRFNYEKFSPGIWTRLRFQPLGGEHPLEPFVGYSWERVSVRPIEGSVLAQERPVGLQGGAEGQLFAGVVWDTRDQEFNATSGGAEELTVRMSSRVVGGTYAYSGITVGERRFWRTARRFVLAQRIVADALIGDVPFYELANVGGLTQMEGVGGMTSVRGVPRNRFVGQVKVFSNTELRGHAFDFQLLGSTISAGALAFLDLGRVWSPGVPDGGLTEWHPGMGLGARLWKDAAVVRVDWGVDARSLRSAFYVTIGHMF
jgi:hypothetical protein